MTNTGLKGAAVPTLAAGYLHYTGSAFEWNAGTTGGGGSDSQGWTYESEVIVSSSQAVAAVFPASGVFSTSKEYKIEFNGWSLASAGDLNIRVDLGSGLITTVSYERACEYQDAGGGIGNSTLGPSCSGVILLAAGGIAAQSGEGYVQFIPGRQATMKCSFDVGSRYISASSGNPIRWFRGTNALSTPVNAAIQKVTLYNTSINTVSGIFILKSRPLSI
jgi:hypothetical protein